MPENVQIQPGSYAKLRQLAKESGVTIPEVLAEAIEQLYRRRFLDACNRAYARLREDPKAWEEERRERRAWDVTLSDGLEST